METSKDYEKVVLFIGLTDWYECEGMDRNNIKLPQSQLDLIDALIKENKKLIVVMFGGSVVELPFFDHTEAMLHMFLSGQNSGEATCELLFGKVNPSGKLAETWPISYEDVPFGNEYSIKAQDVYKESIYVGYRYYLTANKEVRFPFGYGLSYTTFEYSNLKIEQKEDNLLVRVNITNSGDIKGMETVQLYVSAPNNNLHKPLRELKGFTKVSLEPKETKTIEIVVRKEDLECWDINEHRFMLEDGQYNIQIGKNSRDIVLEEKISIKGKKLSKQTHVVYETLNFSNYKDEEYEEITGNKIIPLPLSKPITLESRLSDLKQTFMGRILYNALQSVPKKELKKAKKMPEGTEKQNKIKGAKFLEIILDSNSIISLSMSSSGAFPYNFAQGFKELSNGHLFKGIGCFLKKIKAPALPINAKEEK